MKGELVMIADSAPGQSSYPELWISRKDLPALYLAASEVSIVGQQSYKRWILANLALVVLAAFLSAASSWVFKPFDQVFAIIIAAVLLGAMVTKFLNQQLQGDRAWFDGRAVAESVKTNAWRYMMRVPPFGEDASSDATFATRMSAIQTEYKGLSQNLANLPGEMHQISPQMRKLRHMEWRDRREAYIRIRLEEQVRWYRGKATGARIQSNHWTWASLSAEFAGVIMALSIFVLPVFTLVNLVGVAAALAAGFQAWTQVCRHAELSRSYAMACQELVSIRDLMRSAPTGDEFVTAVEYSEEAISREHTMWVAKRTL